MSANVARMRGLLVLCRLSLDAEKFANNGFQAVPRPCKAWTAGLEGRWMEVGEDDDRMAEVLSRR